MSELALKEDKSLALPKEEIRKLISDLEALLLTAPVKEEIPVTHYFANSGTDKGLYAREITIKKGVLLTGKIHKFETINVISSGEVTVFSQDGKIRTKAPYTFVSTPGAKRSIYAHTDATWTCFHATGETDLAKIEKEFIAQDYSEVNEEQLCLG